MKKAKVFILLLLFTAAFIISSCNRKLCPAYTKADTEQVQKRG